MDRNELVNFECNVRSNHIWSNYDQESHRYKNGYVNAPRVVHLNATKAFYRAIDSVPMENKKSKYDNARLDFDKSILDSIKDIDETRADVEQYNNQPEMLQLRIRQGVEFWDDQIFRIGDAGGEIVEGEDPPVPEIPPHEERIPDEVTSYTWSVRDKNGNTFIEPLERVRGVLGDYALLNYFFFIDDDGPYECKLTVKFSDNTEKTHRQQINTRDYLIVSIGDSYASGEGNPDISGRPEGIDVEEPEWYDYVTFGMTYALKIAVALLDAGWEWMQSNAVTLTRALGWKVDMEPEPVWIEKEAHRSVLSGHSLGALKLRKPNLGRTVTYLTFARSGSEIVDGLIGPRTEKRNWDLVIQLAEKLSAMGFIRRRVVDEVRQQAEAFPTGIPKDDWINNWGQLEEVRRTIQNRKIDALLISIGGNDVGFSGTLKDIVANDSSIWRIHWGGGDDTQSRIDIENEAKDRINALDGLFDDLREEINSLGIEIGKVFITEYPTSLFEKRNDSGGPIAAPGCELFNSDLFDLDLDQKDSEMLRRVGNSLNSTLEGIVKRFNNDEVDGPQWVFIDGIVDPFRGRGYCTSVEERLFVTASSSLVTQGDTEGTAHPNNKGHAIIGQVVHEHLLEHLVDTRPSAPVPPENPEAGAPRRRQAPRPIDPEARQ